MSKIDIYQEITNKIILSLEEGNLPPWVKPWSTMPGESAMPSNFTSHKDYRGVNVLALWASQQVSGFTSNQWLTYKQASENDLQVRKGEHGSHIIFWKFLKKKDENGKEKKFPMAKTYTVFNVEQCDGYELPSIDSPAWDKDKEIESRIEKLDVDLEVKGSSACFIPSQDVIRIPDPGRFDKGGDYYATLLHELTHWTGHKSRLDRPFSGAFGSPDYAREELVAELGAAFLSAHYKLDGKLQHEEYLSNWLSILKEDKQAIIRASSLAQLACDYVLDREGESIGGNS